MITVKVWASIARTQVQLSKDGEVPRAVFVREFRFAAVPVIGAQVLLPIDQGLSVSAVVRGVTHDLQWTPSRIHLISEIPGLPRVPFDEIHATFTAAGWERAPDDQVVV